MVEKHTPAPWKVADVSGNSGEAHVIEAENRTVAWTACSLFMQADYITEEDKANGRLIALSPVMFEALCACHDKLIYTNHGDGRAARMAAGIIDEIRGDSVEVEEVPNPKDGRAAEALKAKAGLETFFNYLGTTNAGKTFIINSYNGGASLEELDRMLPEEKDLVLVMHRIRRCLR